MKYTVYQTTCKINGKIYIGKHQTEDPYDDYLGSGKMLHRAIKRHGRENFEKKVLHIFDNEEDMNAKEAELVTEEFVKEDNYNLCPGGQGGWGYVNLNPEIHESSRKKAGKRGGFSNRKNMAASSQVRLREGNIRGGQRPKLSLEVINQRLKDIEAAGYPKRGSLKILQNLWGISKSPAKKFIKNHYQAISPS